MCAKAKKTYGGLDKESLVLSGVFPTERNLQNATEVPIAIQAKDTKGPDMISFNDDRRDVSVEVPRRGVVRLRRLLGFYAVNAPDRGCEGKAITVVRTSGRALSTTKRSKYRCFKALRERYRIGEEYDIILVREDQTYMLDKLECFALSLDILDMGFRLPLPEVARDLLSA
ncbi:hypothetical protein Taro_024125 [Colocasia esculenta]|uniref:Uncharacterized protein n=1 Tax=Colocasia esculenta TaxID=4460 RepID=A0A843VJF9_COLES|nr:hypothetical protein [Colocasia esculenta]